MRDNTNDCVHQFAANAANGIPYRYCGDRDDAQHWHEPQYATRRAQCSAQKSAVEDALLSGIDRERRGNK